MLQHLLEQSRHVVFHLPRRAVGVAGDEMAEQAPTGVDDEVLGGGTRPGNDLLHTAMDEPCQQSIPRRAGGLGQQAVKLRVRGGLPVPGRIGRECARLVNAVPQGVQILGGTLRARDAREHGLHQHERRRFQPSLRSCRARQRRVGACGHLCSGPPARYADPTPASPSTASGYGQDVLVLPRNTRQARSLACPA